MEPSAPEPTKPLSNFTPQNDPSKFIRTYAKDVAAISGVPAPAPSKVASLTATISDPNRLNEIHEQGVTLQDYDSSPVNRTGAASPEDFPQEKVELNSSDSDGIFASSTPSPSFQATPVPQPSAEAERESILARLRAKVGAQKEPASSAPLTEEPPMRAAAPDFSTIPEPALPMPAVNKERVSIPVPMAPPAPAPDEASSPIHTYSSDFADRIDTQKSSTFSVLAAQSDAVQAPRTRSHRSALVPLIAGFAMLLIGAGAIAGAYLFTKQGGTAPAATNVPTLIKYDESVEVKGSGGSLMEAVAAVGKGGSVPGNVVVTYVTLATSTGTGIPQPGGVLINEMNLPAPDILLRNIDQMSTVGVIRAGSEARPFLLLKVNSYERTFAGMLAWEPTMASDLAAFYPAYASAPVTTASSTASATSPVTQQADPTLFTDAVVANYDVRILRDASGRSRLLYGYRGKNTLIIARDEAAFTSLLSRLNAAGD